MLDYDMLYPLAGALFTVFAIGNWRKGRVCRGLFWLLYALCFFVGNRIGALGTGAVVLAMAGFAVAGFGKGKSARQVAPKPELGNWLFLPALLVPLAVVVATFAFPDGRIAGVQAIATGQVSVVSLAAGAIVATVLAMIMTRTRPLHALREAHAISDQVGWTMALPQVLAMLGSVFVAAKVSDSAAAAFAHLHVSGSVVLVCTLYCGGMALLTVVFGNAFAAFPIAAGILGIPVLVKQFHGDANAVCALGMLAGYCGTLVSPMAANFNIIPVSLLDLRDRFAVIRTQAPTAALILGFCTLLLSTHIATR